MPGTSTTTWRDWNTNYTVTGTNINATWDYWNSTGTATSAATFANAVWTSWSAPVVIRYTTAIPSVQAELSPEQREADERAIAAEREQDLRERLEREAAKTKATRLLVANLGPTQRRTFKRERYFVVRSRSGKRYRVNYGAAQNIKLLDNKGTVLKTYCIHPREIVPVEDTMLAQKLMIQHDEEAFLRIANVS